MSGYFALNYVFAPLCLASDRASFENNCVKTDEDRRILLAAEIFGKDSSLWQHKVYVDIRAGSLEKRRQKDSGVARWGRTFSWLSKTIA